MSSVGPLSIRDFDELKMSSEDKKATHISRSQVGPNPNSGITSVCITGGKKKHPYHRYYTEARKYIRITKLS